MSVANDKGDNEMILGPVHRSSGICFTTEENPRDRLMKGLCDQSLPPNEVGRIAQQVRMGEGRKGRGDMTQK
jgi:hypothetical protein